MDSHETMKKIVQQRKEANDRRYEAHSQDTLKRHVTTKFKTTMIGALAKFEELFGDSWGHGKSEDALTEPERLNREKWQTVRTEILNQGNSQLRAAMSEIEEYTIRRNKKIYDIPLKKEDHDE